MNKWYQAILNHVFRTPVPTGLEWRRIEALFTALGAKSIEGRGSRVRFELNDVVATFTGPIPRKRQSHIKCAMPDVFCNRQV